MNIFGFIKTTGVKAKDLFIKIFGAAVATQLAATIKAIVKTDLGALAVDVVALIEAESPTLGSTQKRDAAVSKLMADASTKGIALAESVANLLIEIAVAYVKGSVIA